MQSSNRGNANIYDKNQRYKLKRLKTLNFIYIKPVPSENKYHKGYIRVGLILYFEAKFLNVGF